MLFLTYPENKQLLHVSKDIFLSIFPYNTFLFLFLPPAVLSPIRLSHEAYWERKRQFTPKQVHRAGKPTDIRKKASRTKT